MYKIQMTLQVIREKRYVKLSNHPRVAAPQEEEASRGRATPTLHHQSDNYRVGKGRSVCWLRVRYSQMYHIPGDAT